MRVFLLTTKKGEILDLVCDHKSVGSICVDEVFPIDPIERLRQIYGTEDLAHPGVSATYKRLGKYALCGEYDNRHSPLIEAIHTKIKKAQDQISAKHTTAIFMAANPLHRAHERLIRQSLERSDLSSFFFQAL